jgi:methionyl-tRNA synthetase
MTINYDEFAKMQLIVGTLAFTAADAGRGMEAEVDLGAAGRRKVQGVRGFMAQGQWETGRQDVVVANLNAPEAGVTREDVAKTGLRVANVLECRPHANADKLLVLQIDIGDEKRQICAGIRAYYQPEQLVGKQIVVVTTLEPRKLRGEPSQGMLLAATDAPSGKVVYLAPGQPVAVGSLVELLSGSILLVARDTATGQSALIAPVEPVAPGSGVK